MATVAHGADICPGIPAHVSLCMPLGACVEVEVADTQSQDRPTILIGSV